MPNTPEKKKPSQTKKAPSSKKKKTGKYAKKNQKPNYLLPALSGLAVVCLLVGLLWFGGAFSQPEPTQITEPPVTLETLPPNPFSAGDFTYNDSGYLTCSNPEVQMGIDVSDHQGWIDWYQVKDSGVSFAFIRIGYRGYSQGGLFADEYAHYNLTTAREAGLQVGAYFYSQAVSEEEAAEEAAWCIDFLKEYEIDLPVVFDWEYVSQEARTGSMDGALLTRCAQVFCGEIEKAGYDAMVYFNPHLATDYYDLLQLQNYPFWLAMYTSVMDYPHRVDYWQYTDQGSLPGIDTTVDINLKLG